MIGHNKRLRQLQKLAQQLDIIAQQLRLPGIQEPQLDLPGIPLEPKPRSEKERFDPSDIDNLKEFSPEGAEIRAKIIHHELKANPGIPKDIIVDKILSTDSDTLFHQYKNIFPELKAKIPSKTPQINLPGVVPEINILPTKEDLEATKERIKKEFDEKVKQYDEDKKVIIDQFKAQHNDLEPDEWTLRNLMGYRSDPRIRRDNYGYRGEVKPEDVKLNPEEVPASDYNRHLNTLYRLYGQIQANYNILTNLEDKLETISVDTELPPPDPTKFSSYADMVHDLRDRTIVGIQTVISDSVGYALFGISAGGRRYSRDTGILEERERNWLDDPEALKHFLEKIPQAYDHKDDFWRTYGVSANDVDYWFDRKINALKNYDDALQRTIKSFNKGVNFLKALKGKLTANVDQFLNTSSFKYSDYIQNSPEHKAKLNELYMELVNRINETSAVFSRANYYYNNGLYEDRKNEDYNNVNIGQMLLAKVPQYKLIESLTKLLISSIKKVAIQINENELGPATKQIASDLFNVFLNEKLGIDKSDLPIEKTETAYSSSYEVIYGDKRGLKVADAWLKFFSGSKLNFNSVVKYPKFIYREDKEKAKFLADAMKERLGYMAASILHKRGEQIFLVELTNFINSPEFVYNGVDELRKVVFERKEKFFEAFKPAVERVDQYHNLAEIGGRPTSAEDIPRYSTYKALIKDAIGKVDPETQSAFWHEITRHDSSRGIAWNADAVANSILMDHLEESGGYAYASKFIDRLLNWSIFTPLKDMLVGRGAFIGFITADLGFSPITKLENISDQIGEYKAQAEELENLKLPQDFQLNAPNNFLKKLIGNEQMSDEELKDKVKSTIKLQKELNNKFNEKLDEAIGKLLFLAKNDKLIYTEKGFSKLFYRRLEAFGGVGPNAISAKFIELTKLERYKHLPLQEMAKLINDDLIKDIKEDNRSNDTVIHFFNEFSDDNNTGSNTAIAFSTIAKKLSMTNPHQLLKLFNKLKEFMGSSNVGREEIEYIFPELITNTDALDSQLEAAKQLAVFAHNAGQGLSKETILNIAKNPNFKDWLKKVDAVEHFFDVYIKIQRLGGVKNLLKEKKPTIEALQKTKAIKRGIGKRLELITEAFEKGTRINPSIEGFESTRSLINQTAYDLNAIEKYATFAEYNDQIQSQKLFKDPKLFKLNWNMPDKKFRFRVLETFDPYHFQVGVDTNCCQKLGGVGEGAAIDSYINPLAGVVLLEAMIEGTYQTISQSYFHYVPTDNGVILDNVEESDYEDELENITGYDIDHLYAWWAKVKQNQLKLKYFLCGESYNKLDNSEYKKYKMKRDPRSFKYDDPYTDWRAGSSVDLLQPKFKLPEEAQVKKKRQKKRAEAFYQLFASAGLY